MPSNITHDAIACAFESLLECEDDELIDTLGMASASSLPFVEQPGEEEELWLLIKDIVDYILPSPTSTDIHLKEEFDNITALNLIFMIALLTVDIDVEEAVEFLQRIEEPLVKGDFMRMLHNWNTDFSGAQETVSWEAKDNYPVLGKYLEEKYGNVGGFGRVINSKEPEFNY
jgi:hypothetical protein